MITIVAILLIFCVVVRYKWRNAVAEKEEILMLVARVSEDEAEIEKLQSVDEYNSPPPPTPPSQLERLYHCAVCHCPTTTRCSQCKAVRYCSGKCQIIHWRQGHKDDCRPVTSMDGGKGSKFVEGRSGDNRFENHEAKVDDSGSSSCSLPCFSSSTERSEMSLDTSVSDNIGSGTPNMTDGEDSDSHLARTSSGFDQACVPRMVTMNSAYEANNTYGANKLKKALASKPDEGFLSVTFKDTRAEDGSARLEEIILRADELRSSQYSISLKAPSVENHESQVPSSDAADNSINFNRRGRHNQVLNGELRTSKCSKSLSTSSNQYWKNKVQMVNGKETRSMSSSSSANAQKAFIKNGSLHTPLSGIDSVQILSQAPSKGLKTSVRKFVQHFRVSKQSKSYADDIGDNFAGNYNQKIIFPPKLFMQLYSCDGLELLPFGLLNCGNSCYANAVLQCLTFTRPIASYLLQGLHSKTCHKRDWCFICELEHLIQKGRENKSVSPVGILSHIQRIGSHLSNGRDEDAHDFLRNVVDTMQSIWLEEARVSGSLGEDSTLMGLTFGGYLRSKIKCMKCLGRSDQCERIMDLTVEIDGDIHTLEEALSRFTISETLSGDDKYECCRCKSYEKAKKKLTVLEAPNVLTIVLKRFRSGNLEKLNKLVQFPEILNLAPYVSGAGDKYPIYGLYAVIVHLNTAAYSGHYISYVKDFQEEWFRIDDSRICHVDLGAVLSSEAYVLFYARHTPRIPSLVANSGSVHSDGKTKRNIEAIPASTGKKKNLKPKPTSFSWYTEPSIQRMPANYFSSHHTTTSEDWGGYHSKLQKPLTDWSSDTSSIFSASDAGSTSTDSTKDSSVEDMSGYIFGSSLYPRW